MIVFVVLILYRPRLETLEPIITMILEDEKGGIASVSPPTLSLEKSIVIEEGKPPATGYRAGEYQAQPANFVNMDFVMDKFTGVIGEQFYRVDVKDPLVDTGEDPRKIQEYVYEFVEKLNLTTYGSGEYSVIHPQGWDLFGLDGHV